jgi:hypothetical protein
MHGLGGPQLLCVLLPHLDEELLLEVLTSCRMPAVWMKSMDEAAAVYVWPCTVLCCAAAPVVLWASLVATETIRDR